MGHNVACMCLLEVECNFHLYKLETKEKTETASSSSSSLSYLTHHLTGLKVSLTSMYVMFITLLLSEPYQAQITTLHGSCTSLGQNAIRIH